MPRIECSLCLRDVDVVLGRDDPPLWERISGRGLTTRSGVFAAIQKTKEVGVRTRDLDLWKVDRPGKRFFEALA